LEQKTVIFTLQIVHGKDKKSMNWDRSTTTKAGVFAVGSYLSKQNVAIQNLGKTAKTVGQLCSQMWQEATRTIKDLAHRSTIKFFITHNPDATSTNQHLAIRCCSI